MSGLIEKIRQKDITVAVVGLGYVGLPLAVEFAQAGVRVLGIDVDAQRVEAINRGESHIPDVPSEKLAPLVQAGRFRAGTAHSDCAVPAPW